MEIYLDNSATTRCHPMVRDIVVKAMMEDYGNPSSMHRKGMEAEQYVREAASRIAATLKAEEREIYFTSGGTEANNWALIGTVWQTRERAIISSPHRSSIRLFRHLWIFWNGRDFP